MTGWQPARTLFSGLLWPGLLLGADAWALDVNDALELSTVEGESMRGWMAGVGPDSIVLTAGGETLAVPLSSVLEARRDGQPLPLDKLRAEHHAAWTAELRWAQHPPPHPSPQAAAGLSLVWAGAGHAALGDWGRAGGWGAVDLCLLGAAGWSLGAQQAWGPALSAIAVDLVVRGAAASSSARIARRRRARIQRTLSAHENVHGAGIDTPRD